MRDVFSAEKIMSVFAFIAAVIALVFSWEANQLARENNEIYRIEALPHTSITGFNASTEISSDEVVCRSYVNFINEGLVPTLIKSFSTEVLFKNSQVVPQQSSQNEVIASITAITSSFQLAKDYFAATQGSGDGWSIPPFPIELSRFTSLSLVSEVVLKTSQGQTFETSSRREVWDSLIADGYSPLVVRHGFEFANEETQIIDMVCHLYLQ